jgi:hypothetical protein
MVYLTGIFSSYGDLGQSPGEGKRLVGVRKFMVQSECGDSSHHQFQAHINHEVGLLGYQYASSFPRYFAIFDDASEFTHNLCREHLQP